MNMLAIILCGTHSVDTEILVSRELTHSLNVLQGPGSHILLLVIAIEYSWFIYILFIAAPHIAGILITAAGHSLLQ